MNPISRLSFIVASHRPSRLARTREGLRKLGAEDLVVIVNPRSLFVAYDTGRRQARNEALCFLHDDVDVEDLDAERILEKLADPKTGFLGVAGTRALGTNAIWWEGVNAPDASVRLSGRCGHRQPDRQWTSEYGDFGPVVALDGVCLFTTKRVLEAIGGFADPPLDGFDFYDLSVALRAHLAGFVNETVPVDLYHWGLGVPRPSWDQSRNLFLAKYGTHLPCALPGVPVPPPAPATSTTPPPPRFSNMSAKEQPTSGAQPSSSMPATVLSDEVQKDPAFDLLTSRQFLSWMAEQHVSLALTTYQAGKLFLLGMQPDGKLSVCERTFNRCMGLWGNGQTLWMTTLYQLWRLENVLPAGAASSDGFDRVYVPQVAYTTGDIDIHDLAVDGNGRVVFANTLFGCLATHSATHSFTPLWQPPFLTKLAAEDRCHLNGLAMRDGRPAYVTCISQSNVVDGWRDRRHDGGIVIDLKTNAVVASGLSMPHSPRWYRDRLWTLNSGTGHFGYVDFQSGKFEPVAFCPGYLRGLAFVGDFAVVGSSKARENRTFQGLDLDKNLRANDAEARCGIYVIDLRSGDLVHFVRVEGIITELYDVVALPGVRRPKAVGIVNDEIRRTISIGEPGKA